MSQPHYVRNGLSRTKRPRCSSHRRPFVRMLDSTGGKLFAVFFVLMLVVGVPYGIYSYQKFGSDCAASGGSASNQYSYSADEWVQVCKNSDGAITNFR